MSVEVSEKGWAVPQPCIFCGGEIRTSKVPSFPATLSCHVSCFQKPETILNLVLTHIVLHQRTGEGSLHQNKKSTTMTKLQISEINLSLFSSLRSLQLLVSLSEQGPDPRPFKQTLWLRNSSEASLICC